MKTAAHGTVTQLRVTRAVLEDGVKKRTEGNLRKHARMEIGQRELQERQGMFRKELSNKSCQSNGRFLPRIKAASASSCVSCGRPELRSGPGKKES